MGMPTVRLLMGNIVMKKFISAKSEARRWRNLIAKSAGFASFIVKSNSKEI